MKIVILETSRQHSHYHNEYPFLYKERTVVMLFGKIFRVSEVSHTRGTCALPDMSALALGCCAPCVHIRQHTYASVTTITCCVCV